MIGKSPNAIRQDTLQVVGKLRHANFNPKTGRVEVIMEVNKTGVEILSQPGAYITINAELKNSVPKKRLGLDLYELSVIKTKPNDKASRKWAIRQHKNNCV